MRFGEGERAGRAAAGAKLAAEQSSAASGRVPRCLTPGIGHPGATKP